MHLGKRASTVAAPPLPKSVPHTGEFDGNDGKWSSFFINVNSDDEGNNGQDFRVLISTSSPLTLLPGQTGWCNADCAAKRGVYSDGKQALGLGSSNWKDAGNYGVPLPYWYAETTSTSNGSLAGDWGKSNVGLGRSSAESPVLANRYVVKYLYEDFFMGSFGLAQGQIGYQYGTLPTFLTQFAGENVIASSSYGFTAGAYYRNNGLGEPGSLVLGGYDKSRMVGAGLSNIGMPSSQNNTLSVGVASISYDPDPDFTTGQVSYTTGQCDVGVFRATIDSTLPFLILPDCVCDKFQESFGLTYDQGKNLYFVNDTMHALNQRLNATINVKIVAGSVDVDDFVTITLGYSAFDHQWSSRTGGNATNYFPIQRSKNGIYVLGRTFLQEAYIIVDYERSNFTVAPAYYAETMPKEDLRIIYNTTYQIPSTESSGLGSGAIAGTVVGIVVAFVVAGIIAFCWWRKRKAGKQTTHDTHDTPQIDPTLADREIKYRRVSELTGSDIPTSPKTPLAGYYSADHKSVPPISEMSPESPPVELYSPPTESASDVDGGSDYFTAGKPHRRGAQRDRASSGHNSPSIPIAELPGDDAQFYTPGVSPTNSPLHSRGPSDASLPANIDERLADSKKAATGSRPAHPIEPAVAEEAIGPRNETQAEVISETTAERRPSHQRGLSDTTIASDSTAVSQPTPEEQERWARDPDPSNRPLSP